MTSSPYTTPDKLVGIGQEEGAEAQGASSLRADRATAVEPVPVSPLRDGIPSAMLVPADVLARRFARYADHYRASAHSLRWWQYWRRASLLGAWAALTLEGEALEKLAAQAIEARSGQTEGLDPKGESAVPKGCAQ